MKNHRVLVIDDDPTSVRLLEKWLRDDGYDVVSALSGEAGWKRSQENDCHAIVLDLMIPDLSGIELARKFRLHEMLAQLPMIFITMSFGVQNDRGDEKIDIEGCAYPIFAKPLHRARFLATLRKEINRVEHKKEGQGKDVDM